MNAFFEDLGTRFAAAAARRGVEMRAPAVDAAAAREILELARVAAHTQERRFAPLAAYLAGQAVAGLGGDPEAAVGLLREVRLELEASLPAAPPEAPAPTAPPPEQPA